MTEKTIESSTQKESFDPLVAVNFKVPFSVREQLKKQALNQGETFDKFMRDLINNALTTK
ncbi:MAG: hypothetical protein BWK79_19425 [Beggiatoa sp. IS2]|nr:MAG: hypothetical protein BWK79_19425 [Beggiatoa sp. IS2]